MMHLNISSVGGLWTIMGCRRVLYSFQGQFPDPKYEGKREITSWSKVKAWTSEAC